MTEKRSICFFTATRAEYGLLFPVLKAVQGSATLEAQLVVMGAHLSPEFGATVSEIERDGMPIAERLETLLSSDSPIGAIKTMGLTLLATADCLGRLKPSAVAVLGDRSEILPVAAAALVARIPVIHIAGGHLTEGAIDDAVRHSVTKMASLHFTSVPEYARRIVQMGEPPERVHVVGSTGLDNIVGSDLLGRDALEADLGFALRSPWAVCTFHPETLADQPPEAQCRALLEALDLRPQLRIVFTQPNADVGGRVVQALIEDFVAARPDRAIIRNSLGRKRYLSALAQCDGVIGNSSSGIIEAPSFRIGTVNIGNRQAGRIRAPSIIDCPAERDAICGALDRLLDPAFRASLASMANPFGDGRAGERIARLLEATDFSTLSRKPFHSVGAEDLARVVPESPPWA